MSGTSKSNSGAEPVNCAECGKYLYTYTVGMGTSTQKEIERTKDVYNCQCGRTYCVDCGVEIEEDVGVDYIHTELLFGCQGCKFGFFRT